MILVGPRVRHQSRLVRPTAKDRVVHLAPPALDASVAPDVVHLAAGFPPPSPEAVRGSHRSALADAPELRDALPFQALPPLDAPPMVVCPCLAQDAAPFPVRVAALESLFESKLEPQVAPPEPWDESELPQEARLAQVSSQEPWSQEPPCLPVGQQPQVPRAEEQRVQPVWSPRALAFQLDSPAPVGPQVSVAQPQGLRVQRLGACAPLSPPRPSLPCPPWPSFLPRLPRPLLPGDVCALSPQHPREWNSSASSFP
jgi:hypothetical protein